MFWRKRKNPDLIYDGKWLDPSNPEWQRENYPEIGEICEVVIEYADIKETQISILFCPFEAENLGLDHKMSFDQLLLCSGEVITLSTQFDELGYRKSQRIKFRVDQVIRALEFPEQIPKPFEFDSLLSQWYRYYVSREDNWVYLSCTLEAAVTEVIMSKQAEKLEVCFIYDRTDFGQAYISIGRQDLPVPLARRLLDRLDKMGSNHRWYCKTI